MWQLQKNRSFKKMKIVKILIIAKPTLNEPNDFETLTLFRNGVTWHLLDVNWSFRLIS